MVTADTIDFDCAYRVTGHGGVAWYLLGYAKEWTNESWEFIGDEDDDRDDEMNYVYNEPEEVEDRSRVRAVMVGDDRVFVHDVEDVEAIADDDYCSGCGQIGCGWC